VERGVGGGYAPLARSCWQSSGLIQARWDVESGWYGAPMRTARQLGAVGWIAMDGITGSGWVRVERGYDAVV